jgi:diaminopimelate decarboxylase
MLYQAYHLIEKLEVEGQRSEDRGQKSEGESLKETTDHTSLATHHYDVVGPICESTDCFQKDVELPQSFRGDLIAIRTAGAYGEVMASGYNLRDRVGSVYSDEV